MFTSGDVYRALRDIGTIFGVENRAADRIEAMRQQIADMQAKIAGREPVKVFYYGSGEGPLGTVGGNVILDELIELASGKNVFHDVAESYFGQSGHGHQRPGQGRVPLQDLPEHARQPRPASRVHHLRRL